MSVSGAGPAAPGRDPGLQPERTRLAWRRTTLSGAVVAVLAVKTALHGGATPVGVLATALCCGLWLAFLRIAHVRIRTLAVAHRPPSLAPSLAAAAALCTGALAVCGVLLVL
ncbi:DUF202 domain-containing protein [Streptomyces olivaceus]|uniref:DUF202 domain-containing protein n=1 Tax=Streptomyces sp. VN1 TaxID=1821625 RepID=UPI0004CAA1A0|nr:MULTISPECIES: DUF202 domain-containing protein [Streptomyces]MBZ6082201.1 DUF202 domain-containing protein [Streptomyces olivaceus]MBZ6103855.1 DUF202 domain-containing protein [Streptomyces olivaceus]MBZ6110356.1 DUF202 domain-containing protein [Streptomyces olivaceus]MBZ6124953.1 DUF202 domain-containing protein [Streptomyces olivaceus]MBZ6145061.1 DUF202 domain-containing protein [Streptomyces olivaceus]